MMQIVAGSLERLLHSQLMLNKWMVTGSVANTANPTGVSLFIEEKNISFCFVLFCCSSFFSLRVNAHSVRIATVP